MRFSRRQKERRIIASKSRKLKIFHGFDESQIPRNRGPIEKLLKLHTGLAYKRAGKSPPPGDEIVQEEDGQVDVGHQDGYGGGEHVDHSEDDSHDHDASSEDEEEFHGFADADALKPILDRLNNLIEELKSSFEGPSTVIPSPADSVPTVGSGGQFYISRCFNITYSQLS